jgi:hypothetical protein
MKAFAEAKFNKVRPHRTCSYKDYGNHLLRSIKKKEDKIKIKMAELDELKEQHVDFLAAGHKPEDEVPYNMRIILDKDDAVFVLKQAELDDEDYGELYANVLQQLWKKLSKYDNDNGYCYFTDEIAEAGVKLPTY